MSRAARRPIRSGVAAILTIALAGCADGPSPTSSRLSGATSRIAGCDAPAWATEPARANAASIDTLPWTGFGRVETGWAIYAPAIAVEVASSCPPDSAGFAGEVLRWQTAQGLVATGAIDIDTLEAFRRLWQGRRPFVSTRARGVCPEPPAASELDAAAPQEGLGAKPIRLHRRALAAYRAMVATARVESPAVAADPSLLRAFSGFRDVASDAARCAREGNCGGVVRAACSAHRTGLAIDIAVGAAGGYALDSSADVNRRAQVRGPAYRWLIVNARRFGFAPYMFEPWHWEWTGDAP